VDDDDKDKYLRLTLKHEGGHLLLNGNSFGDALGEVEGRRRLCDIKTR
jgi:hypothetical protein